MKMAVSINKVAPEIQQQIIQDYQNGKSMRQIEKDYGVSRQTTSKFLEKQSIKTTKGNHHRTYYHDEDYFEKIDTEHKAYWLGFIFADGHITNHDKRYGQDQFGISQSEEDIDVLYRFKEDIKATNPIHKYNSDKYPEGKALCRIQLVSQKTVNDLIDKGCYKQKSLILQPPKNVPNELIPHFIRGYFDGDGSIIKSKNNKYKITDGYKYDIDFTTTKEIADWLVYYFDMGNVIKEPRREKTYYYRLGGHKQIIQFYHILYDNATIYMERKYNRFQELLSKYNES